MSRTNDQRWTALSTLSALLLTVLAAFWVVEESRPNLTLLAVGAWVLWGAALLRGGTTYSFGDDWVGVRGKFSERRLNLQDVEEIRIEQLNGRRSSVMFVGRGFHSISVGRRTLESDPELNDAVDAIISRNPDKVRVVSALAAAWH